MPPVEKVDSVTTTNVALKSSSQPQTYTEVKLQIRLTNGNTLTHTFGAKEPLSAVRLYVQIHRTDDPGPFTLMTSFNRYIFGPDDFDKPLDLLGNLHPLDQMRIILILFCRFSTNRCSYRY